MTNVDGEREDDEESGGGQRENEGEEVVGRHFVGGQCGWRKLSLCSKSQKLFSRGFLVLVRELRV